MVAVHVHDDGSIAIDAAASKIREILVRDGERAECPALGRRKTNVSDPLVETPITPLDPIAPASGPDLPHVSLKGQARSQHSK
jgi:hypothetical protein